MEEVGIPELTFEQLEELCEMAEANAKENGLPKIPSCRVITLNVADDGNDTRPFITNIAIEGGLSPTTKFFDVEKWAEEATARTLMSA